MEPELEARLSHALDLAEEAPALAGMLGDMADRWADENALHDRVASGAALLERITRPETLAALNRLVDLAESLPGLVATASDAPTQRYGVFGLVGLLKDPQIQRAVSFAVAFARAAGAQQPSSPDGSAR